MKNRRSPSVKQKLNVINGTLPYYMFRFVRNIYQGFYKNYYKQNTFDDDSFGITCSSPESHLLSEMFLFYFNP
jgi:hypothetical protein